jgi:lipopolysaccharide transport system ATP-binding protein
VTTPAVLFDRVSKKFRRGEQHDSLRDLIPAIARRLAGQSERTPGAARDFWAVRDVTFHVSEGEALGIMGPNGAGKSTILKLLTRILRPTSGTCAVRGRIGALIEVSAGFHQDLTGRENVYLQGAIMGMKRAEIARKFDDIVAFAGVNDFIDTPVKRYSSGMNARLGFAIAAHLDPDVLLIDEVLSVGDAAFQEKCVARMRQLIKRGTPVIFISHNLPALVSLCSRAIVLSRGAIQYDGTPADAVQHYRMMQDDAPAEQAFDGPIRITRSLLLNERGERSATIPSGGALTVRVEYEAAEPVHDPVVAVDIHNAEGVYCAGVNTRMPGLTLGTVRGSGAVELQLASVPLLPGTYVVSTGILDGTCTTPYDLRLRTYPFSIVSSRPELGIVHINHAWHLDRTHAEEDCVVAMAAGGERRR